MKKRIIAMVVAMCFMFTMVIGCSGTVQAPGPNEPAKLAKVQGEQSVIGGVCSGMAYFTGTPAWLWRVGFVVVTMLGGAGIFVYVVMWMFMPTYSTVPVDYVKRTGGN